jgi:hypothetical protein
MTQIAFQRKLQDRGLDVVGQGAKATINNRVLKPRAVPTSEVDWGNTLRAANSF